MQLSNAIRQRIIELSKINNLSLAELSRRSGIPYPTIISFMLGKTKTITLHTLYFLCLGLEVELIDFFNDKLFDDVVDEYEKRVKDESY